ncbi:MAG TPA: segregation/condensation protein A [Chloroflexota bacterium]|nr:segregation/condensation protein A [Chloroflexota bacterium]
MEPLVVALPEFTGPLELLLDLIQKRQLDVTALSLAAVADQYLEQVLARQGELEPLSEFLVVASQLLLIKSRALLRLPEECDGEDPAAELRQRLVEYQAVRAVAQWLAAREQAGWRSWPHGGEREERPLQRPLAPLSGAELARLAARLLRTPEQPTTVVEPAARPAVRERAALLLRATTRDTWVPLAPLLGPDVPTAVATFLAVLLLVRLAVLAVRQPGPYAGIELRRLAQEVAAAPDWERWR